MNRRRIRLAAGVAMSAAALSVAGYVGIVHHVGAPKLPITCQAPDFPSRWWVPGSGPAGVSSASEVHWLGSTELGGCSETLTVGLDTRGADGAADRLVFGEHQHNLMGAVTGIYDQPDGKYAYLALAAIAVVLAARSRRSRWLR